ncbi:MAG: glutaredoxin [Gemmatimonadales bacterium]|jgi:glutaredoxin|nr:glutaredoxin [Gemmatimonadales bacterium]
MSRLVALLASLLCVLAPHVARAQRPPTPPALEVFVRADCPHCAAAKRYLDRLQVGHPGLRISYHEVIADAAARQRLLQLARERGLTAIGVPAFLVGDQLSIGWDDEHTTGAALRRALGLDSSAAAAATAPAAVPDAVDAPLVGRLSASRLGLPLFTVALGLLDGFNPCAMWALLLILALLVGLKDRRRMLLVGGTFVLVGGVLYFAFMAAWLELFLLVGVSRAIQVLLALVAIGVGLVNLKDFVAFGRGPSLGIPEAAKPGLYARMRRVVTAERLGAALVAVAGLSVMVNTVELLCTAGLPTLYTQILGARELPRASYYGYLLLYNLAYILDDMLMLAIAVTTLSRPALQERAGRWLKLVSGAVMLALGLVLLLRPAWLS